MKYFLSVLACLTICQASFSQMVYPQTAKAAQTKKDITAYKEFQKKEEFYNQMQEYKDAEKALKLKEYTKAVKLLKLAAAKKNPVAEYALGSMYWRGLGVPKNDTAAVKWYLQAADNGNMYGLFAISDIYSKNPHYYDSTQLGHSIRTNRFNALKRCVEAGFEGCWILVGIAYQLGEGVTADYSQALYWYKKGAEKGDYQSMEQIAVLYYRGGNNLNQSKEEAIKWYKKAANEKMFSGKPFGGSKAAMYKLYEMFSGGDGIEKNQAEAFKWLLKLGENKEKQTEDEDDWMDQALYFLGNAYYTGTGVTQNYNEALKWFTRGAELNRSDLAILQRQNPSLTMLAIMYREGQGVKKDLKIAEEWQRKADLSDD